MWVSQGKSTLEVLLRTIRGTYAPFVHDLNLSMEQSNWFANE